MTTNMLLNHIYYRAKPFLPRTVQIALRRQLVLYKRKRNSHIWPIDPNAGKTPEGWTGWPEQKRFALVLSHDVDTQQGHDNCRQLVDIEESLGFKSSFSFVPERYNVSQSLRNRIISRGFEVGVHGLKHDGKLFLSKRIFQKRAVKINRYLKEWDSVGFTSPSMHHRLDWMHDLKMRYDTSTFDTDPFEPQPDSVGTVFPFWVHGSSNETGYVELPYSLPQDHTLFIIMKEKTIDIWKQKLDWIADKGGMALFNTHPDYMNFCGGKLSIEEYPAKYYEEFLEYIRNKYDGQYWHVLPKDMALFWWSNYSQPHQGKKAKIKACMLAYTFYENDGRVRKYSEILAQKGLGVDVIALKSNGQSNHEIINGVNLYRIQTRSYDEKGKLSFLYRLMKFFTNSTLFLSKKHLANPYDIIHVHSVPDFEVFATIIPKLLGAKIILDIHDPVPDFFAAKFGFDQNNLYVLLLKLIERISTWYADHVITVTDHWRHVIKRRSNLPENKISVIVNFSDMKMFNTNKFPKHKKSHEEFMLLYPGTLNKHCGLDIVIQALSILKDEIPSLRLHIYGEGKELKNLQLLVTKLGLGKLISFQGVVPLDNVPELMNNADIGIALLSGHNEYSKHALNVKLFEFLAMGLPSIATRTNSIEYYLGEDVAMLSKPNDYRDVAMCIRELYMNPNKRTKLQKRGLRFTQNHNWDKEMHVYMSIVDQLKKHC